MSNSKKTLSKKTKLLNEIKISLREVKAIQGSKAKWYTMSDLFDKK